MKHLPDKFLNEPWEFKGRLEPMVTKDSEGTCASYSLAFIEHLIPIQQFNLRKPCCETMQLVECNGFGLLG
ncbi:hypothetical protein H5410_002688 [Solanum commersonii]|uniref:Uncharacterized protein n=1 Tax=Solanum commersonii TaxID=4109 RepID=A0A9J6B2Z0_SOLCO|nr:hypothetical protein H5410_002688 [Solanum commersonii]